MDSLISVWRETPSGCISHCIYSVPCLSVCMHDMKCPQIFHYGRKKGWQTHHRYRSNNLPYDHLISLARQCTSHKTTDEALHHHEVAAPTMRRLKPRRLQVIYLVVLQHRAAERKDWNRTQIHVFIFINTITCGAYFEFDIVNSSNKVLTSAVRYGPNFISR